LDVPKDSKLSSSCFLFPHFSAPLELAEGGDRLLDSVFSESSIPFLSRLSVVLGASLFKADSSRRSPSFGSGGREDKETWFYKNKQVKKIDKTGEDRTF
jgi:hypothetical protein